MSSQTKVDYQELAKRWLENVNGVNIYPKSASYLASCHKLYKKNLQAKTAVSEMSSELHKLKAINKQTESDSRFPSNLLSNDTIQEVLPPVDETSRIPFIGNVPMNIIDEDHSVLFVKRKRGERGSDKIRTYSDGRLIRTVVYDVTNMLLMKKDGK